MAPYLSWLEEPLHTRKVLGSSPRGAIDETGSFSIRYHQWSNDVVINETPRIFWGFSVKSFGKLLSGFGDYIS